MASRTKCSCFATSADKSKIISVVDDDTESSLKEVEDSNVTLCVGLLFFLACHISGPHFVAEVVVGDNEDKEDGGVRSNFDFKVFVVVIFVCLATGDCGGVSNDGAYLITPGLCKRSSLLVLYCLESLCLLNFVSKIKSKVLSITPSTFSPNNVCSDVVGTMRISSIVAGVGT